MTRNSLYPLPERRSRRLARVLTAILLAGGLAALAVVAILTVPVRRASPAIRGISNAVAVHAGAPGPVTPAPVRPRIPVRSGSSPVGRPAPLPTNGVVRASTPAPLSAPPHAGPPPTIVAKVNPVTAECAVALAYLATHAKPGFAHYCRPQPLRVGIAHAVAFTCVPGTGFTCPDGVAEIIIADPACAISYENEASNSFWNFSTAGVIAPSTVQYGRTWDPFGSCS